MNDIKPCEKPKFSGEYFKIIFNRKISFAYSLQIKSIKKITISQGNNLNENSLNRKKKDLTIFFYK